MMKFCTRKLVSVPFFLLCFLWPFSDGCAFNTEKTRQTLQGVKGFRVAVESLDHEVERSGLKRKEIQEGVESILRRAGIKVVPIATKMDSYIPLLYINIQVLPSSQGALFAYNTAVNVFQLVSILDHQMKMPCSTWSTEMIGMTPTLGPVKDSVRDMMDVFLEAYRSVNPN